MNEEHVMRTRNKPEVLAPAGNLRGLKTAVDYGADAVYCGGKAFGMRSAPRNLSLEDFEEGSRYAHERGARVYVTCNVLPRNAEVEDLKEYLGQLKDTGVDALIVTDIGVMMAARRIAPNLEIHISTQAGVTNYLAANALYELGAKRVVLAREMDLQAVRDIRANIPEDMDIECFVHGAMCMAFSGRCLFSNYLTGRDGNHGECAQPCRWKYSIVEEKRPGRYFPIEQTQDGAYLFNSQDMNMLEHLDDLIDAGATSLKIEGRSKSAYYIAAMTNAYKSAVNEYMVQRGFEDEDGTPLAPFHDCVRRTAPGESPRVGEAAIETDTTAPAPVEPTAMAARGTLQGRPSRLQHRLLLPGASGHPEHRSQPLLPRMARGRRDARLVPGGGWPPDHHEPQQDRSRPAGGIRTARPRPLRLHGARRRLPRRARHVGA